MLEVNAARLAADPRRQLRAIARECMLLSRVPLLTEPGSSSRRGDRRGAGRAARQHRPRDHGPGAARVALGSPRDRGGARSTHGSPAGEAVAHGAPRWHGGDAEMLADRYPLAPALMFRGPTPRGHGRLGRAITPEDIYAGIRAVLDDSSASSRAASAHADLGRPGAARPTSTRRWSSSSRACASAAAVYEQWGFAAKIGKGLGVSALFSGPPGTGKTMVAALDRARSSASTSTRSTWQARRRSGSARPRRTSARCSTPPRPATRSCSSTRPTRCSASAPTSKSCNDRYANLETNYLLQRLESFAGICILTTNHEVDIDPAFQRRLSLHVRFELPDEAERARLWRVVLPAAAPAQDIDSRASRGATR